MKRTKFLAVLLSAVLVLGMIPATSAAGESDLRQAVANHTLAVSKVEWKLAARIARLNHPVAKTDAMHEVGVLPTTYFEYTRSHVANLGVVMENTSASYERFCSQIVNGTIPADPESTYYGMNADAFLVDVVSRVSTVPITGVKQAMTSGALVPLVEGVKFDASSSADAMKGVNTGSLSPASGDLNIGDIFIAWDDNAKAAEAPKLSVMVVTDVDVMGYVTVTYPAFEQPTYYFTCDRCGTKSTEGPTSAILTKHIVSTASKFTSFAAHKSVDPASNCPGTFVSDGASTWHTSRVTLDQLFSTEARIAGGGLCYVPFTIAAYDAGKVADPEVKVTTDATAANVMAGFEAHIDSNYRIVRVDAVLSQPGRSDKVFTNYTQWTDWSYDYQNDALDLALSESDAGQYTLKLNVHTGPLTDPDKLSAPVVEAYTLDMALKEPSMALTASAASVNQGELVYISVDALEDGISKAELTVKYDADLFQPDEAAFAQDNSNATLECRDGGQLSVRYNGKAVSTGSALMRIPFRAKRTGDVSVAAKDTQPFVAGEARIAKNGASQMEPVRAGGEQLYVGLGLNAVIYTDYAAGKDLLLIPIEGQVADVTYGGQKLTDVSRANYIIDGMDFTAVYAIVGDSFDVSRVTIVPKTSGSAAVRPGLLYYNGDINDCGVTDIRDVQTIADIINGKLPLEGNMVGWLRADMDRSGKLDINDVKALMAQIKG